jgi:DNA-binding CsgD family transcriptional regulator
MISPDRIKAPPLASVKAVGIMAPEAESAAILSNLTLESPTGSAEALGTATLALNMFAVPTFLVRPNCEIVASSSTGPALLETSRAFFVNHGKLTVRRATDTQALLEAVGRVVGHGMGELLRFLTRQEEASALMRILAVPQKPLAIIAIAELRAPMLLAHGWSMAAFGFSAPHAALAESLALGHSLAEFAETHSLPIGTVRTRLKKLLVQTGTSSQASLAAMLQRASVIMSGAERLANPPKGRRSTPA